MSDAEEPEVEVDAAEEPGESAGMSERTAKIVLLTVGLLAMWGIVAVLPETAYFVAGIMACRGWQKTRGWIGRRQGSSDETAPAADEVTAEDVVETLHEVANPNVFLADFAAAFDLDTGAARALLEGHEIRVRRAVRNGDSTGVGVHRDDVPPLPRGAERGPAEVVDLQQQHQPTQPTVEQIGLAGVVVKDGSETGRRHRV
jgi:hypothetical protein